MTAEYQEFDQALPALAPFHCATGRRRWSPRPPVGRRPDPALPVIGNFTVTFYANIGTDYDNIVSCPSSTPGCTTCPPARHMIVAGEYDSIGQPGDRRGGRHRLHDHQPLQPQVRMYLPLTGAHPGPGAPSCPILWGSTLQTTTCSVPDHVPAAGQRRRTSSTTRPWSTPTGRPPRSRSSRTTTSIRVSSSHPACSTTPRASSCRRRTIQSSDDEPGGPGVRHSATSQSLTSCATGLHHLPDPGHLLSGRRHPERRYRPRWCQGGRGPQGRSRTASSSTAMPRAPARRLPLPVLGDRRDDVAPHARTPPAHTPSRRLLGGPRAGVGSPTSARRRSSPSWRSSLIIGIIGAPSSPPSSSRRPSRPRPRSPYYAHRALEAG